MCGRAQVIRPKIERLTEEQTRLGTVLWEVAGGEGPAAKDDEHAAQELQKLLAEGAPVQYRDRVTRTTALFQASQGRVECVKVLLAAKPKGEAQAAVPNRYSALPLHRAAAGGFVEVVRLLLAVADGKTHATIKDKAGNTPLHRAVDKGHATCARLIVEAEPKVAAAHDYFKSTPLHVAVRRGRADMVAMLLDASPRQVVYKDSKQMTPLYLGCSLNKLDCVKEIMVRLTDDDLCIEGRTTVLVKRAVEHGRLDILMKLLDEGGPHTCALRLSAAQQKRLKAQREARKWEIEAGLTEAKGDEDEVHEELERSLRRLEYTRGRSPSPRRRRGSKSGSPSPGRRKRGASPEGKRSETPARGAVGWEGKVEEAEVGAAADGSSGAAAATPRSEGKEATSDGGKVDEGAGDGNDGGAASDALDGEDLEGGAMYDGSTVYTDDTQGLPVTGEQLWEAVQTGSLAEVKRMFQDVGYDDRTKLARWRHPAAQCPPIFVAAKGGFTAIVEPLLRASPDEVHARDRWGMTPLHTASAYGRTEIVAALLKKSQFEVGVKDRSGATPLHRAASKGFSASARAILRARPEAAALPDRHGQLPLHVAARQGKRGTVAAILETGTVDLHARDRQGRTAMELAAAHGHDRALRELLEARPADGDGPKERARLVVHVAAAHDRLSTVKMLFDVVGAELNVALSQEGKTALHLAVLRDRPRVVEYLLRREHAVDAMAIQDYRSSATPLHVAVMNLRVEMATAMLAAGSPFDVKDRDGHTALDCVPLAPAFLPNSAKRRRQMDVLLRSEPDFPVAARLIWGMWRSSYTGIILKLEERAKRRADMQREADKAALSRSRAGSIVDGSSEAASVAGSGGGREGARGSKKAASTRKRRKSRSRRPSTAAATTAAASAAETPSAAQSATPSTAAGSVTADTLQEAADFLDRTSGVPAAGKKRARTRRSPVRRRRRSLSEGASPRKDEKPVKTAESKPPIIPVKFPRDDEDHSSSTGLQRLRFFKALPDGAVTAIMKLCAGDPHPPLEYKVPGVLQSK